MRYKLTLRWRGTDYCGWQVQPGVATVCGTVQDAVEKLFGRRGELTGCSRTDSGVHAAGFVAALGCAGCCIPPEALLRALNVNLPRDIAVTACEAVGEDFHPRYDAAAKRYRYRWYQSETRDPFREGLAVQLPRPVDAEAMDRAAKRKNPPRGTGAYPDRMCRDPHRGRDTPDGDGGRLSVQYGAHHRRDAIGDRAGQAFARGDGSHPAGGAPGGRRQNRPRLRALSRAGIL